MSSPNAAPFEILGAPFELWIAPTGTDFPDIDETPAIDWKLVGTNGNRNLSNDGVKVTHKQTLVYARPDGMTGPAKAFRTEEDLMIEFTIWDLTLEQYKFVLNDATITTVPASSGIAGSKSIPLTRGAFVAQHALLLRGPSPYMDDGNAQYEVPQAVHDGNPVPMFKKGTPAGLLFTFTALGDIESPTGQFGTLRAQTAAAES